MYLFILFIMTGIIAGYLTNLYAVRWLFRPIKRKGKLPAWDVSIVSTEQKKQKLIQSLADCVTDSILTSDVLKKGIPDSLIEKHLNYLISDVWNRMKPGSTEEISQMVWSDLPQLEELEEKGNHYIVHFVEQSITPLCKKILSEIDVTAVFTEKQINQIAVYLYELLEQKAKEEDSYAKLLDQLYENNKTITLEQLIGADMWESFEQKLYDGLLQEQVTILLSDREKLEQWLDAMQNELELEKQIHRLQLTIGQKKIRELIEEYRLGKICSYFWKESGKYWSTVEGRRVLRRRKKELIQFLLSMDVPIRDMFTEETWSSMEDWIRSHIPAIISPISDFLKENEEELNEVIKRSIHIAVQKNNRAESLIWLEEQFQLFLLSQIKISERLQNILQMAKDNDSEAIAAELIDLLKTQKVCDIVKQLLKQNKSYLWKVLWKEHRWLDSLKKITYDSIKDRQVSWLLDGCSISFANLICKKGKDVLLNRVEGNPKKAANRLLNWTRPFIKNIRAVSIEIVDKKQIEQWSALLSNYTAAFVTENRDTIISLIGQWIISDGKQKVNAYLQGNAKDLSEQVEHQLIKEWKDWEQTMKKQSIGASLAVFNKEKWKEEGVRCTVPKLGCAIHQAIQGQIHQLVVDALNQLNPDQLCNQVERLMGGELKYLSYFGGLLGFLISLGVCYWAVPSLSIYGSSTTWSGCIINVFSMGVIGVVTNIAAIWMLFRPKKEIKWLAKSKYLKLFSKGVILQNQEKFASTMAEYVSKELISEKAVCTLYEAKKLDFPQIMDQWIDGKGMTLLKNHSGDIAEKIVSWMFQKTHQTDSIKQWIAAKKWDDMISFNQINSALPANRLQSFAKEKYDGWEPGEKTISDFISEDTMNRTIAWIIQKGEEWLFDFIKTVSLEELAVKNEAVYQAYISKPWSLEQKKQTHLWIDQKWEKIDTTKRKEEVLIWLIKKVGQLQNNDTLVGEFVIAQRSVRNWADVLLEKKMDDAIDWFYLNIIKKKIEQTFGYEESEKPEGENWWDTFRKQIAIFGIQEILEPIFRDAIWELKEVQLPLYLKSKKQQFHSMIERFLEENIYESTVGEVTLLLLGEDYPATLNRILFGTIWREPSKMSNIMKQFAHMGVGLIFDQALSIYLHMFHMDSLVAIEKKLHKEVSGIYEWISKAEHKKEAIAKKTTVLLVPVIREIKICEYKNKVDDTITMHIIQQVISDTNKTIVMEQIVKPIWKNDTIEKIVCIDELEHSLGMIWKQYEQKDVVIQTIKQTIADQLLYLSDHGYKLLSYPAGKECTRLIVETVGAAFQAQLKSILEDLNLYDITEERIKALTPEQLEQTIRAFANPIFQTLYALGFVGAVGGINCYIAIIIYFIELRKSLNSSVQNTEKE